MIFFNRKLKISNTKTYTFKLIFPLQAPFYLNDSADLPSFITWDGKCDKSIYLNKTLFLNQEIPYNEFKNIGILDWKNLTDLTITINTNEYLQISLYKGENWTLEHFLRARWVYIIMFDNTGKQIYDFGAWIINSSLNNRAYLTLNLVTDLWFTFWDKLEWKYQHKLLRRHYDRYLEVENKKESLKMLAYNIIQASPLLNQDEIQSKYSVAYKTETYIMTKNYILDGVLNTSYFPETKKILLAGVYAIVTTGDAVDKDNEKMKKVTDKQSDLKMGFSRMNRTVPFLSASPYTHLDDNTKVPFSSAFLPYVILPLYIDTENNKSQGFISTNSTPPYDQYANDYNFWFDNPFTLAIIVTGCLIVQGFVDGDTTYYPSFNSYQSLNDDETFYCLYETGNDDKPFGQNSNLSPLTCVSNDSVHPRSEWPFYNLKPAYLHPRDKEIKRIANDEFLEASLYDLNTTNINLFLSSQTEQGDVIIEKEYNYQYEPKLYTYPHFYYEGKKTSQASQTYLNEYFFPTIKEIENFITNGGINFDCDLVITGTLHAEFLVPQQGLYNLDTYSKATAIKLMTAPNIPTSTNPFYQFAVNSANQYNNMMLTAKGNLDYDKQMRTSADVRAGFGVGSAVGSFIGKMAAGATGGVSGIFAGALGGVSDIGEAGANVAFTAEQWNKQVFDDKQAINQLTTKVADLHNAPSHINNFQTGDGFIALITNLKDAKPISSDEYVGSNDKTKTYWYKHQMLEKDKKQLAMYYTLNGYANIVIDSIDDYSYFRTREIFDYIQSVNITDAFEKSFFPERVIDFFRQKFLQGVRLFHYDKNGEIDPFDYTKRNNREMSLQKYWA